MLFLPVCFLQKPKQVLGCQKSAGYFLVDPRSYIPLRFLPCPWKSGLWDRWPMGYVDESCPFLSCPPARSALQLLGGQGLTPTRERPSSHYSLQGATPGVACGHLGRAVPFQSRGKCSQGQSAMFLPSLPPILEEGMDGKGACSQPFLLSSFLQPQESFRAKGRMVPAFHATCLLTFSVFWEEVWAILEPS